MTRRRRLRRAVIPTGFLLGALGMHAALADDALLAQQTTMTISGLVLDSLTGRPLAGAVASVEAVGPSDSTDSGGEFQLERVPVGQYVMRISMPGFLARRFTFTVPPGPDRVLPVGAVLLSDAPDGFGTIEGDVRDGITQAPLPWAKVMLNGSVADFADAAGRFRIEQVEWGAHRIDVLQVGYHPGVHAISLRPSDQNRELNVRLDRGAVRLPELTIEGDSSRPFGTMAGFYERRERTGGYFFTREEIERREPREVSELMRAVPRMSVSPASGVGPNRVNLGVQQSILNPCRGPTIVLDGMPLAGSPVLDDVVSPDDIEALEVYPRSSDIPPEFNVRGAACGVVVIWTRFGKTG